MQSLPALSPCAELVRAGDRDRFMSALTLPVNQREAVFALCAFNLEISRIPELVSEEMIGFIRFAWWREALDELYAGQPGRAHEVVQGLRPVIASGRLAKIHFERLMEARLQQFAAPGFETHEAFSDYCADTAAPLLALCLEALEQPYDNESINRIGVAYATMGYIRALPFQKNVLLPEELLMRFGVPMPLADNAGLREAIKFLADSVTLTAGRGLVSAYRIQTQHYLNRLRRVRYNPFDPRLEQGRGLLALKLLLQALRA